jgi:NAD(P)H-hydrate epimerase
MAAVTAEEMRRIEDAAFARGVEAGALMDEAGAGIAAWLLEHFPRPGRALAFVGKGNNGGDALVALEHLRAAGWRVGFRASHPAMEMSVLARRRRRRLGLDPTAGVPPGPGPLIVLDGLLGIGASGALREPLGALAREMAELRARHGAQVVAVDLPSGFDAGDGGTGDVVADITLTLGVPKIGLFADGAAAVCGRLGWIPLAELEVPEDDGPGLVTPRAFPAALPRRAHTAHKGDAGRVTIFAGSPGMGGAGALCAEGCLRGGAGLVRWLQHPDDPVAAAAEVMARRVGDRVRALFESDADALVAGPGLGDFDDDQAAAFCAGLEADERPAVLDADALNLLAARDRADLLAPGHLITPHPGEFARLAPDLAALPRFEAARAFVARHPCTLLLKGARTVVATPGRPLALNPCGHAGMAGGGQGDVLGGVAGALLGAGIAPHEAAVLAAWLCGRAAERALTHGGQSVESCLARDTLAHLGGAFSDWREARR